MLTSQQVDTFWRQGFLRIPGVYNSADIQRFRSAVLTWHAANDPGDYQDLLSIPSLADTLTDGKAAQIARDILGQGDILYFGDSSVNVTNHSPGVGEFHRDNVDRWDGRGPDWVGNYTVLRFGLYLQDHSNHSGGPLLRIGSHKTKPWNYRIEWLRDELLHLATGNTRYINLAEGELVVWTLRTAHAGHGRFIKPFGPRVPVTRHLQPFVPGNMQSDTKNERCAIFYCLGLNSSHLERYIRYLKTRREMHSIWCRTNWSSDNLAALDTVGVRARDMRAEIDPDNLKDPINDAWVPLSY